MTSEIKLRLADDRRTIDLTPTTSGKPITMNADELSGLIRHLAWVRASMFPPHEPVDLKPETTISSVPAIRWQATEDVVPEQSRLFLLHPGFGWIYIRLDRPSFDDMSVKTRLFLQRRPQLQ
jgi:hypothetical protein